MNVINKIKYILQRYYLPIAEYYKIKNNIPMALKYYEKYANWLNGVYIHYWDVSNFKYTDVPNKYKNPELYQNIIKLYCNCEIERIKIVHTLIITLSMIKDIYKELNMNYMVNKINANINTWKTNKDYTCIQNKKYHNELIDTHIKLEHIERVPYELTDFVVNELLNELYDAQHIVYDIHYEYNQNAKLIDKIYFDIKRYNQ